MRIVKDPCLIDFGPNPSLVRAVGERIKFNKTTEKKVHRERLRLFMRKGGWISIIKWKMIPRLQFIRTHVKYDILVTIDMWRIMFCLI